MRSGRGGPGDRVPPFRGSAVTSGVLPLRTSLLVRAALTGLFVAAGTAASLGAFAQGTLEAVRARGSLQCGVTGGMPGFASVDGKGRWSGLFVEYCQAVSAAVLGSKEAVKVIPLADSERFEALKSGSVDILVPSLAWTLSRDSEVGALSAGTLFHDGQAFLVHRGDAVASVFELSGSSICVLSGTSAEQGLVDFFRARQMKYQLVVSEKWPELVKSYETGGCTLLTADLSLLAIERSRMDGPSDHLLLPELISKEPLGPMVREGDDNWFRIARWTLMALVAAEELNVTAASADTARQSPVLETRRLLGADQSQGPVLGLSGDWALRAIRQVGSYGEIFERNLGLKSPLRLERGYNALWNRGGLMYAGPFR